MRYHLFRRAPFGVARVFAEALSRSGGLGRRRPGGAEWGRLLP